MRDPDHRIRFSTVATQPDANTYRLNDSCPLYNVEFIGVGGVWVRAVVAGAADPVLPYYSVSAPEEWSPQSGCDLCVLLSG